MADYTLAVGTGDPYGFAADDEAVAIRHAAAYVEDRLAEDLRARPETVITLLGPGGLLTRPSERIDEFVRRVPGDHPAMASSRVQPGDANTPDCNGD